jgi:2-polyprenyl-3-methyl-5-hydroxy-6-metoxy-1,4-benzoquinol methylase
MNFFQNIFFKINNRINNQLYKNKKFSTEEEYYSYLFTKNSAWNSPEPNEDESIRWGEIKKAVETANFKASVDILEIGCGRGWLSKKLSSYGKVTGIEPVELVVKYAKKLFPSLEFYAAYPASFIEKFPLKKFDLIVSSEVIEHVVEKVGFMKQIQDMLNSGGVCIITTPRMEAYNDFVSLYGVEPGQPVEEWLSESEMKDLLTVANFEIISNKSFAPLPIKDKSVFTTQMWVFRKK